MCKKKYASWRKEKSTEAWEEYKKSKQNTKNVISLAKGKKQRECARDLMILTNKMKFFE